MIEIDYTGQHIGEYLLLSQVARGAFSNVYLAQQGQPSLLPSTEQALLKAIAEQPGDRWPSILAFLTALSESMKTT